MASSSSKFYTPAFGAAYSPLAVFIETAAEAQRLQWQAVMTWYGALAAAQQEAWDEWTCRFGGGVPIDA